MYGVVRGTPEEYHLTAMVMVGWRRWDYAPGPLKKT
jgi:hypothetical protein